MCDICLRRICPPPCPNYSGEGVELPSVIGSCFNCCERIREGDEAYIYGKRLLCRDCAENTVSEELLCFLDCADVREFFDKLC